MNMSILLKIKPDVSWEMDDDDTSTFQEWMIRIDSILMHYRGVTTGDLPDIRYRDLYDERVRPVHAANEVLAESMN